MPKRTNDGVRKRCKHSSKGWRDCADPWWFGFHHRGREHRYSLTKLAEARGEKAPVSKEDALAWRDRLRGEIRAGTFVDPTTAQPQPSADARLTFGDVCDEYVKRFVLVPTRRAGGKAMMETLVALARRAEIPAARGAVMRLDAKAIDAITKADLEAIRTWRRAELAAGRARAGAKGGEAGINRLLSRLRHIFNWSIEEGYIPETPFKRGSRTVVKIDRSVESPRTRRLDAAGESEEERLFRHADPHLRAVLTAALTTGCRIGEILTLQWWQVQRDDRGEPKTILLAANKTKTNEARVLPIGGRLRAELSMRRHAPDGREHPATAYVFGTATGESISLGQLRRQWEDAVLRAHGQQPERVRGKLTPASTAAFRAIDLHIHDLRREFASRLLESGAALHDVQMFLGHENVTTTSTYLRSAPVRLSRALAKMEDGAFAHDSHTADSGGPQTSPEEAVEKPANLLN